MRNLILLVAICVSPVSLWGQIHLSEVLFNEPGSRTRLEWIELYNPEDIAIPLSNYQLVINSDTITFTEDARIAAGAYAVLCRQLSPDSGSDSFEGHWGDSSGYWGDYALEDYLALDFDFSLANSSGSLLLLDNSGGYIDHFSWSTEGIDGSSFERDNINPSSNIWHQCQAARGSTPGHANSTNLLSHEFTLKIEPRVISLKRDQQLTLEISATLESPMIIEIFSDEGIRKRKFDIYSVRGSHSITWDGTDDAGGYLEPGIYVILCSLDGKYDKSKSIPVVIAP